MREVLEFNLKKIENSKILKHLNLERQKYFVVSAHREENIENPKNFSALINSLNQISKLYSYPIVVSVHPRTRNKIEKENVCLHENIRLIKPIAFSDYISLQKNSFVVLSDSGTISEESAILRFKALNIRTSHERPEAMENASVMMVGLDVERILQGIKILEKPQTYNEVFDYLPNDVSHKVSKIILSYTDFVNKYIWQK